VVYDLWQTDIMNAWWKVLAMIELFGTGEQTLVGNSVACKQLLYDWTKVKYIQVQFFSNIHKFCFDIVTNWLPWQPKIINYNKAIPGKRRNFGMQSVPITTKVVSFNPIHDKMYLIQHHVIMFVSDLRQVGIFSGYIHQ
jgi:hypothetical protein